MGIHTSIACKIVQRMSKAIASLYKEVMKIPSSIEEIKQSQNEFYNIARFPRVIGASDGSHIKIESPGGNDAEIFRNRKDYFSVNIQG
ncbi:hypothetical protein BDFB_011510, partial [Asbolus verrucosus]